MQLSNEQEAAARRSGQDACCVAGPGSGKTRVLVSRFVWLVQQGADPRQILVITFTEKATRQLKTRVAQAFETDESQRALVERAPVHTIDGFCQSLLRTYSLTAGLDPEFRILDERESHLEAAAAMEAVLDRFATGQPEHFRRLLSAWDVETDQAPRDLLAVYEKMRSTGSVAEALRAGGKLPDLAAEITAFSEDFAALLRECQPLNTDKRRESHAQMRAWLDSRPATGLADWLLRGSFSRRSFASPHMMSAGLQWAEGRIAELKQNLVTLENQPHLRLLGGILLAYEAEYRARKRALSGLDFADLNEQACALLRQHRDIRKAVQERYRHVLMDELQDTSPAQWELVNLVKSDHNLFAVGDINQSIYGFRKAEPRIFQEFQEEIRRQGVIDELMTNYRGDPGILDTVNRVSAGRPGIRPHVLLAPPGAPASPHPVVEVLCAAGQQDDDETLALRVAERVHQLVGESAGQLKLSQIAVLARSAKTFDSLEAAFASFGLPCLVKRGRNFFSEPEVVDLTNWLRVLDNARDEASLVGLLRSPFFSLSDEQIYARRLAGTLELPEVAEARRSRAEIPIDQVLGRLVDRHGYLHGLQPGARANVAKFLQLLSDLQRRDPEGIPAWLEAIDGLRAGSKEANALAPNAEDAVEILTVHTAKGLEWPVVILTAMEKNARGWPGSLSWSPAEGLGAVWRSPLEAQDRMYAATALAQATREEEELDRLLYVAMTRAERKLILAWRSTRGESAWVPAVTQSLELEFDLEPFRWVRQGPVRTMRLEGRPGLPAPGALTHSGPRQTEDLAPLEVSLQAPPSVSVTALAHFHDCPRRHFLGHILHWPQRPPVPAAGPDTPSATSAMALGTEVHELLAGLREESGSSPQALEWRRGFEASDLGRRASQARRVEREFDFLVEVHGTLVQGAIDLWFEDEQGLVLVDYKSDALWSAAREQDYALQLRLYALALARHTGRPVTEAWLFRLRDGTPLPVDLSGDLGAGLVQAYQQSARAGHYPLRVSAACPWCPYYQSPCPAGAGPEPLPLFSSSPAL